MLSPQHILSLQSESKPSVLLRKDQTIPNHDRQSFSGSDPKMSEQGSMKSLEFRQLCRDLLLLLPLGTVVPSLLEAY